MGHYAPPPDAEKEIHVLVAGAGPFYSNSINPSELIAAALPEKLRAGAGASAPVMIHIHTPGRPWRVAYRWVRERIPPMLFLPDPLPPNRHPIANSPTSASASEASDPEPDTIASSLPIPDDPDPNANTSLAHPNYDVVLFIGMAGIRRFYTLETQAHRDGYLFPDVDGETMENDAVWTKWNAPAVLQTGFETDDVWRRWKAGLVDEDLRPSSDAGHFLCDFIFYTGLVEYWRRDPERDRPVMFLHVPGEHDEEAVQKGVRITSGLILALVQSHLERGKFK